MKIRQNQRLYIRPHHLICMQGFQGYGYSEEFVKNMTKIINTLDNNSDAKIELITKPDNICYKCPNRLNEDLCKDEEKIKCMDMKVLNKLKLKNGETLKMNDPIFEFVNKRIQNSKDAHDICGSCSWTNICLWFKKACSMKRKDEL